MAIGVRFGQWNLSGSDVCKFLAMPLKEGIVSSLHFFSVFWLECEYYGGGGTIAAMLGHVTD